MEVLKNFISLKEASAISGYNSDYLSFLIRAGKLNGQKVGRSWVTTREDLDLFITKSNFTPVKKLFLSSINPRALFITSIFIFVISLVLVYIAITNLNKPETKIYQPTQTTGEIDHDLYYRE